MYRLLDHELAALDDEQVPAPESEDEPSDAPPEPAVEPEPELALTVPDTRDLAYSVRLIDAALLAIDAAVEIADDTLAFDDLLGARDLALHR